MVDPKQHIADLAEICFRKGVAKVIISPGSRSAPVIRAFLRVFDQNCVSIVDERSAAYFALGNAVCLQKPVAIICTSGTAVLNYAPALAEAYYQGVPLLAITADRAREWIDQQDNQTLRQKGIYRNYIKASFELPQYITNENDLWFAHRLINEAVNLSIGLPKGPVHLNIPLPEPLYEPLPEPSQSLRIVEQQIPDTMIRLSDKLLAEWNSARNIMIIHGQDNPDSECATALAALLNDPRIVVLAENIANISHPKIISNSNLVLSVKRESNPEYPDLILHSGGHVVSKSLTGYLRNAKNTKCWRIGNDHSLIDTFKLATTMVPCSAPALYTALANHLKHEAGSPYCEHWLQLASEAYKTAEKRLHQLPFSDAHIFKTIASSLSPNTNLILGNSSIIRYAQLFLSTSPVRCYSNRGTSGIDGCLSTASGIANASNRLTIAVIGDSSFLYDSNALWNRQLPQNLRILVINNQGGGIFHILKGPSEQPGFKQFIEAYHPVNIAKLAEAYGLKYNYADNEQALTAKWDEFVAGENRAAILEVKTDAVISASSFRQIMAGS